MTLTDLMGLAAATLTTTSFVPQAWKSLNSGDTRGISLWMYSIFVGGLCCWLTYGILLRSAPIILANSFTLVFAGSILTLKVRNVIRKLESP
jgi:MtN3 and saliva related transmembrane protein